jgi:hypothetical protein
VDLRAFTAVPAEIMLGAAGPTPARVIPPPGLALADAAPSDEGGGAAKRAERRACHERIERSDARDRTASKHVQQETLAFSDQPSAVSP